MGGVQETLRPRHRGGGPGWRMYQQKGSGAPLQNGGLTCQLLVLDAQIRFVGLPKRQTPPQARALRPPAVERAGPSRHKAWTSYPTGLKTPPSAPHQRGPGRGWHNTMSLTSRDMGQLFFVRLLVPRLRWAALLDGLQRAPPSNHRQGKVKKRLSGFGCSTAATDFERLRVWPTPPTRLAVSGRSRWTAERPHLVGAKAWTSRPESESGGRYVRSRLFFFSAHHGGRISEVKDRPVIFASTLKLPAYFPPKRAAAGRAVGRKPCCSAALVCGVPGTRCARQEAV